MLHSLVFFTLKATILPVLSARFNKIISLFIVGVYLFICHTSCIYTITLGIPTIVALGAWALYRQAQDTNTLLTKIFSCILQVILPLACFTIFITHPIGSHAILYACYWFLPPVLYLVKLFKQYNNIFFEALGITLITHAIGSILWLYTVPMTTEQWLMLIPIVAIERLLFALVSAGAYRVIDFITGRFKLYAIKITAQYQKI